LYNNKDQVLNTLKTTKDLSVDGTATINNLTTNDITINNAKTINGLGRLHVGGPELLYLLNKGGVIIGKDWGGNGNLTVGGDTNIAGSLRVGNWQIYEDGNGRLQFKRGNDNLLSLPKDTNDPAVFRSTGLMYTNKGTANAANGDGIYKTIRPAMYNAIKADPDRAQNIMLLGGTQGNDSNQYWSVVTHRKLAPPDNRTMLAQVALHGHAPICPADNCRGTNDWNNSVI
jgi:hypothetical protein